MGGGRIERDREKERAPSQGVLVGRAQQVVNHRHQLGMIDGIERFYDIRKSEREGEGGEGRERERKKGGWREREREGDGVGEGTGARSTRRHGSASRQPPSSTCHD